MDRLARLLATLSPRERALLGVATVLVLPLAVVFLVVLPLLDARDAARADLARATDTLQWIETQAAAYPRPASEPPRPAQGADLSEMESNLRAEGLWQQVTTLEDGGASGLRLAFEQASFLDAMAWLTSVEPMLGYTPTRFRIEAGDASGLVDMRVDLEPAQ